LGRNPSPAQAARNKLGGAAKRHLHDPDHPEVLAARRNLAALTLEEHIKRVVDSAPPLTPAQRERLALLLHPGEAGDG
jgi:hypothetical protein